MAIQTHNTEDSLSDIYGCSEDKARLIEEQLTNIDPEFTPVEVLTTVVDRMTDVQKSIEKFIARAEQDIAPKAAYLAYLDRKWTPFILKHGPELMKKEGQVTLKLGSGIIRYQHIGGWKVEDKDALIKHLESWTDAELAEIGAERSVRFVRKGAKAYERLFAWCEGLLRSTGEAIPGVERYVEVKNGKCRIGVTKPWSIVSLMRGFKKVITQGAKAEDDEEDDE